MLEKKYNHLEVEQNKYDFWLKNDFFKSGDLSKEPFCVVIPPPNVTGKLHLGHAWDTSLQDIIIRYKRMDGYDALWLPGMDHAGVATQAKIDARIRESGVNPKSMKREEWMDKAWEWKEEYANIIRSQWAKLGLSLDYSKERFTMDEGFSKAVRKVFIDLYNKGLIYRDTKPINWDPVAKTALSNIEVIYKKEHGKMYYLKYMFPNSDEYLEVATTRTETLASDTAVVVNPNDERYKHLIGKTVITPLRKEEVPIIADEYIDMEFGTGAMKCSAHAVDDFAILKKNNLPIRESINPDGLLNSNALMFEGMTREEARVKIAEKLQEEGLVTKIEDIVHEVGHSERTDAVVEIMVMPQWFVKMKPLADNILELQKNKDKKVNFVPKRFEKILINWMSSIQDWCISRQVWWGHRIPAWYKNDEIYVGEEAPKGDGWVQDEDVLDTWFSSALWPFGTLGWPENLDKRYFPNNLLVTGYDIIFFWVSRMMFMSLYFNDVRPFKEVLIHGLIRDKIGRKMSKSLGNGVDPMDVIDEYGADSLRYFISTTVSAGSDLKYDEEKIKAAWNFINKLWNASRYVLMKLEDFKEVDYSFKDLKLEDKWILTKLNQTIKAVRHDMEKYNLNNAGNKIYTFVWDNFCDWYIELSKNRTDDTAKNVLLYTLTSILKLLHPFIPYVTEEIYQKLPVHEKSIMISSYPKFEKQQVFKEETETLDKVINDITMIRNMRSANEIGKDSYVLINCSPELLDIYLSQLKIDKERLVQDKLDGYLEVNYQSKLVDFTYIYLGKEIDKDKLKQEIEELKASISRREKLLANPNYVNKAPSHIVDLDRTKLKEEQEKLAALERKLDM